MPLRGRFSPTLCSVVLAGAIAGCVPAARADRSTLVIADSWEPRSLDPLVLQGTQVALVNNLLFSYLLDVGNDANPVPEIAREVPTQRNGGISADGKTIRYRLRRDVRFSDGVALTARDVVFTFEAIMDPRNAAASRYGYDLIASVKAPDDASVVVRLKRPFSPIISTFLAPGGNYGILPAHVARGLEPLERSPFAAAPVGSGPYELTRWERGERMTFSVNPRYYGKHPAIERIVWKFVPSPQTIASQLRTGEVDATFGALPGMLPQLRGIADRRVVITPVLGLAQLQFNTTDALLSDVKMRRALGMLFDWRRIVARATQGAFSVNDALRGVFGWSYDPGARFAAYDPRAAQAMLSADGWIVRADGLRHKGNQRLELGVALPADEDTLARVLTQMQADAAAAGIRLVPHLLAKSLYKSFEGPINQGRYQSSLDRFASAPDPDPGWLVGCSNRAPRGFNRSRFCDSGVEAAVADGVQTYDRARRLRDYALVQRRLAADVPFYPIYQDREIDIVPSRLSGFVPSTQDLPLQGVQNWSLR